MGLRVSKTAAGLVEDIRMSRVEGSLGPDLADYGQCCSLACDSLRLVRTLDLKPWPYSPQQSAVCSPKTSKPQTLNPKPEKTSEQKKKTSRALSDQTTSALRSHVNDELPVFLIAVSEMEAEVSVQVDEPAGVEFRAAQGSESQTAELR